MGYDPADSDPYEIIRRQMQADADAAREAVTASGTQPFQTVRKVVQLLRDLLDLVSRLPQVEGRQVDVSTWPTTGWPIPGPEWMTVASTTIPRPPDKSRVVVQASSSATGITTHGGALAFSSRIVINDVASIPMTGTSEGSIAITRASTALSFVREISGLGGDVTVELQLNVIASGYTDDQRASLSVYAGFSVV